MSPAEVVAAAIARGEITGREGEQLLGFVALLPLTSGRHGSRATYYRRWQLAAQLGLEV